MVFNPLFLQNTTGLENIHPEKVNKLNNSGYLFSDIINVFMNSEEGDSLTAKLTQEYLGSAQIKESNGTPVILSLLGESSLQMPAAVNNLKLEIEDLLPPELKNKLTGAETGSNKNVKEKVLTANQKQLEQILQTINNLLGIEKTGDKGNLKSEVDLSGAKDLLQETDGVFLIVETTDKVFNINISKQPEEIKNEKNKPAAESGDIYKIKFSLINENSLLNSQGVNLLASNNSTAESQLSFLPFESELAEENVKNSSAVKLKIFTYQKSGNENVIVNAPKNKLNDTPGNILVEESIPGTEQIETTAVDSGETTNIKPEVAAQPLKQDSKTIDGSNKWEAKTAKTQPVKTQEASENNSVINGIGEAKKVKTDSSSQNIELKESDKVIDGNKKESGVSSENSKEVKLTKEHTEKTLTAAESGKKNNVNEAGKKTETQNQNPENIKTKKVAQENSELQKKEVKEDFYVSGKTKKDDTVVRDEIKSGDLKTKVVNDKPAKETSDFISKPELKETAENKYELKKELFTHSGKAVKEKDGSENFRDADLKITAKTNEENKENEQLNIKVSKAVKNITTVKSENVQNHSADKPVKEASEVKTSNAQEKPELVKQTESGEKNFSQNENSFKHNDENKNILFDANKINSTQTKEKFTLDEPVPNSNSERIVKVAEIMKEISKFIEKQDKSTLTIKVSPEDLGKLKITLDVSEQHVKANIHVENEAVKTIIEKNIVELQNQMSKNGIQLTSVNISLSEGEQQKNAKNFVNKKKSNPLNINENNAEEIEEEKVKMMGYNTIEYLA